MKLIDLVLAASGYAPEVGIRSGMLSALGKMRAEVSESKYMGAALMLSIGAGLVAAALSLLLGENPAYGLFGFAVFFGAILALPGLELGRRTSEFESRLPLMLRTLGMLLDMRIPFQRALAIVSQDEPELRPVVDDVSKGVTLQKAFARVAISYDSFAVKRAISQLLTAYEVGSSGREISRIGDEMLSIQRHALREYASKSAIFGLMFIMSAAVLPTFFLVYAVLGKFTGSGTDAGAIDQLGMAIAMLLVFPLISFLILMMAKGMLPRSSLESDSGAGDFIMLVPTAMFVGSFLVLPQGMAVYGIVAGCAAAGYLLYGRYNEEKRTEEIEKHLPDALFAVSGLPKSTKMEDIFGLIERAGYGPLSVEAGKCRMQLGSNLGTGLVLDDLASRNRSPMLRRSCDMLGHVFSTNSFDQLNRLAEDMLRFVEVRRERAGLLSMQKYTLVFGGLLVPLILKITLNLLGSMAEFFSNGGAPLQLDFAFTLIPAYLIIYALLSSFYIGSIDVRKSQSAGYFLAIAIMGLAAFFFINI